MSDTDEGPRTGEQDAEPAPADAKPAALLSSALKARAQRGVVILVLRTVIVQVSVLGGQVALARLLDPKDFGVYAIVQFAMSFFVFFGDAGLGGALIQKKKPPTREELSSVFFVQLFIALAVMVVVGLTSGFARLLWPDLPSSGPWLIRALSLEFLLTTLRTIPCILLERELFFGKLAVLDLILTVAFYLAATVLAWLGFGVWSLVVAVLVQGTAGLVVAYVLRPFRPMLALDRELLRPILRFGVPFQLNRAVGFLNGAVTPIYAGAKLGAGPLGFINWAQTTAFFPLKLVEIFGRIAFPLYSRLQDDRPMLGETFGRMVHLCAAATAYFVALFLGMGPLVIRTIFGAKWMPALPLLHVYAIAIGFGFFAPLVGAVLDSTGRPGLLFRLSLVWTALNWLVVPITTSHFGIVGFSAGYAVHVVVGNLALAFFIGRLVPHARLLRRIWSPLIAGALVFVAGRYGLSTRVDGVTGFSLSVVLLAVVHVAALFAVDRRGLIEALSLIPAARHTS